MLSFEKVVIGMWRMKVIHSLLYIAFPFCIGGSCLVHDCLLLKGIYELHATAIDTISTGI